MGHEYGDKIKLEHNQKLNQVKICLNSEIIKIVKLPEIFRNM